ALKSYKKATFLEVVFFIFCSQWRYESTQCPQMAGIYTVRRYCAAHTMARRVIIAKAVSVAPMLPVKI
ncbi:TPA: hypothetical protein ACXI7C_005110, partial [Serratia marcescens]